MFAWKRVFPDFYDRKEAFTRIFEALGPCNGASDERVMVVQKISTDIWRAFVLKVIFPGPSSQYPRKTYLLCSKEMNLLYSSREGNRRS